MQIRDKATGIFAYIIVILIAIPFAFWGIQEYFGGPGDQKVAEVNGEEISKRLFDSQLQNQRRYLHGISPTSRTSVMTVAIVSTPRCRRSIAIHRAGTTGNSGIDRTIVKVFHAR